MPLWRQNLFQTTASRTRCIYKRSLTAGKVDSGHDWPTNQLREVADGQTAFGQVRQSLGVDRVAAFGLQQFQEINPALGVGAGKPGEPFVANRVATPVLALMAGTGIVGLKIRRRRQPRRLDRRLFLVEGVVFLGQQVVELASGELDPQSWSWASNSG